MALGQRWCFLKGSNGGWKLQHLKCMFDKYKNTIANTQTYCSLFYWYTLLFLIN